MSRFDFLKKMGLFGALACLMSGCVFNPDKNVPAAIYGPPEMFEEDADISDENEKTPVERADENGNVISDDNDEASPEEDEGKISEGDEDELIFEASSNVNVCIYGPPEMLAEMAGEEQMSEALESDE